MLRVAESSSIRGTTVRFVAFATVAVVLFVGLFRMMTNSPGDEVVQWSAEFTDVSGLRVGDDVRLAGVEVGRVESIEVAGDDDRARVGFSVRDDVPLHRGTRLTLRYQNLLGQRYLALTVPEQRGARGERLEEGARLPLANTSPGFDLTALLNGFEPLFAVLEPAEVNRLAQSVVAVLQGESGTVEQLLEHTAQATGHLADRDEVFGRVLRSLTPVLRNLEQQSDRVDGTVVALRRLMQGLADARGTLAGSIDELADLVDSTSTLLQELRPGLRRDVRALRETAGLVVREQDRVRRVLRQLAPLLGAFARTMSYGGFLNVYLCNLGVEAGGPTVWLPGAGGPYTRACR